MLTELASEAESRPCDEAIEAEYRRTRDNRVLAAAGSEAVTRAARMAQLVAERNQLREQLRDAESDRDASAAAELVIAAHAEELQAELHDAREQHAEDLELMRMLRVQLDAAMLTIRAMQAVMPQVAAS
jgi:hypothetical protein